ncbi:hypothetical protein ACH5RR_032438 [Cinchona calisaya]|uniref:Uncharacterized protein n=1 Tax=Cinchona calisaya TaxID=153742 RepID=A0ABD2YK25_9GENT
MVDILIDTAGDASNTILNTSEAMKDMSISLAAANPSGDATADFVTSTSQRLDTQAADIHRQAKKNGRVWNIYSYDFTELGCCNCFIKFENILLLSPSHASTALDRHNAEVSVLQAILRITNIKGAVSSFAGDTCTALEGFQQDPYDNSLSSILPCNQFLSAKSVLLYVSAEVYNTVNQVNRNISITYGNIAQICNPFSAPPDYRYQHQDSPANTFKIGDIPQLLKMLTCPDSEGRTCTGGIVISTKDYNMVETYTTSIQRLLNEYPGMESLVHCQTLTTAFSDILNKHRKPLKRYTRMVRAPMVFLSMVMVVLILIWDRWFQETLLCISTHTGIRNS